MVGTALVDDPRMRFIAFTASKAVGLEVHERAANQVRRALADLAARRAAAAPGWEQTLRAVGARELDPLTAAERLLDAPES